MSDEERTVLPDSIKLADDFVVIQPQKPKSIKRWLLPLCFIIIIAVGLWFYHSFSQPLIRITLESRQIISEKAFPGTPIFLDNDTIAFSRSGDYGRSVLAFRQLTPSGKQFHTKAYSKSEYLNPMASPDAFIFMLKQYNTPRIYILPFDGTPKELAYGEWASISNDGKKVVFQRDTDGNTEIWVMNSDGTDQKSTNLKGRHPECSPKRNQIVFEGNNASVSNIQTAEIDNPERSLRTLTKKDDCLYPSFSPDGKLILFYKKGDGLWVMNRNGSRQQQILKSKSETVMGRISPDGKRLAVWSGTKNEGKLSIYKIEYKNIRFSKQKVGISTLVEFIDSIKGADESVTQGQPATSVAVSESIAYVKVGKVIPKEGILIYVDDNRLATTPIDDPISVELGMHTIKLENPNTGTNWEEEHDFQIGETYTLPEIDLR